MPFKKGESGNPSKRFSRDNQPINPGRPKKIPELEVLLSEVMAETGKDKNTVAQLIIKKVVDMALKGNLRAAELVLSYAYGKPKQQIDHTTDNQPIKPPAAIVFID